MKDSAKNKAIERLIKEDVSKLVLSMPKVGGSNLEESKKRLNALIDFKTKIQTKRNELKEAEQWAKKLDNPENDLRLAGRAQELWDKANKLYWEIERVDAKITEQENAVQAYSNAGSVTTFKDQNGQVIEGIPDLRNVDSSHILFDEETILTDPRPPYIPGLNLEKLNYRGFALDAMKVGEDDYLLALEPYQDGRPNTYVLVTLGQLVLISDYYLTKQKAVNIAAAEESNRRTIEHWRKMPFDTKAKYLKNVRYRDLRKEDKKRITEAEFEAMPMETKVKEIVWAKFRAPKRVKNQSSYWNKDGQGYLPASFHKMFERFVDKSAYIRDKQGNKYKGGLGLGQAVADPKVSKAWNEITTELKWKAIDIREQRKEITESRKAGMETSYGQSNTSDALLASYGILTKRQNGDTITAEFIEEIKNNLHKIETVFGGIRKFTADQPLVVSHSDKKMMYAMRAIGVYIPSFNAIGVSGKYGPDQFADTFAHEIAHYIDHELGSYNGRLFLTDDFASSAYKVADTFRKLMNDKQESDYLNSSKECFARAMQQHFAIQTRGFDSAGVYDQAPPKDMKPYVYSSAFVNKENYQKKVKPLIETFLKQYKDRFSTVSPVVEDVNDLIDMKPTENPTKKKTAAKSFGNEKPSSKGKKATVHYYPYSVGYKKSLCGIEFDDLGNHSDKLKWVTCKTCLKAADNQKKSSGKKHSAKNWAVGDYVKNVKTGTIAKIWNVDFDNGRMQLEDMYGNKEQKFFTSKDWQNIGKKIPLREDEIQQILDSSKKRFESASKAEKKQLLDRMNELEKDWKRTQSFKNISSHLKRKDAEYLEAKKRFDKWLKSNPYNKKPKPKDTTQKRKAGAKGYLATRLKMAERGDFKDHSPIEVLFEAQKFQSARTKSGAARDEKTDGKKRLSPTPENLVRWMRDPGRFDLIGVDTFKKNDPTADLKIKKEIFWSRLLKK